MRRALVLLALVAACEPTSTSVIEPFPEPTLDDQLRQALQVRGVMPIGAPPRQSNAMIDLGRSLFFDKILSGNRDVSCATCHEPGLQLTDGLSLAVGTGGSGTGAARTLGPGREFVPRNAPTLLNQGTGFTFTLWDGRVNGGGSLGGSGFQSPAGVVLPPGLTSLIAAQAMLPVLSRVEMRGNAGDTDVFGNANELADLPDADPAQIWKATMARLLAVQAYVAKFNSAFLGVPTSQLGFQHAANAIAAFQIQEFTRTNSPFDRYLARDNSALTDQEKRGALLFFGKGRCSTCHSGALLGGQQFANIGVPQIGPGVGKAAPLDAGRAEHILQGSQFQRFTFRVPALRNVELTAPYMHNGAFRTLEAVVLHYTNPDSSLRNYDVSQLDPAVRPLHHGDAATHDAVLFTLDGRLGGVQANDRIQLTEAERLQIVLFLKALTDPAARDLSHVVPSAVPSGLPIR